MCEYSIPADMRRKDGSSRYAYVTMLMRDDGYLPGALTAAWGLLRQGAQADLVCIVTPEISPQARKALRVLYDRVLEVGPICMPNHRQAERRDLPYVFTRLQGLRLGPDGDMGLSYEKIVLLDADIYPMRHFDHLFTLNTPAGILNERKENCMEYDADGRFIVPPRALDNGKWNWHAIYGGVCPHGATIPASITAQVAADPGNMGVNASLLVLRPSMEELYSILTETRRPDMRALISERFNWPEMQYMTLRWSGRWTNVDIRFASPNGYPDPGVLFGIHYCGLKPWSLSRVKQLRHYSRHPDFRLWYREYIDLVETGYPELLDFPCLRRLASAAWQMLNTPGRGGPG